MKRTIYLDHAATTQPFPEVLDAMLPYYGPYYGNPSSAYELGEESKKAVEQARKVVAATLYTEPENIYFTSGGTESDNWALRFAVNAAEKQREVTVSRKNSENYDLGQREADIFVERPNEGRSHIITSSIEHHAILKTCEALEKEGVRVTYLPVDREGIVSLQALENAICPETCLISIMYANNEIGTIQPVAQIASIAKHHHILFHSDGVQAYGQIPIDPKRMGIDLLSASGHKFNGPKGTGFLYAGPGLDLKPFIFGGAQEKNMRAGTENVPGIVGMGKAAWMSHQMLRRKMQRETALRDYFLRRLIREVPNIKINGSLGMRLPNNINCSIEGINGGALVALLDLEGICASSASACSTGSDRPSHVQLAIGNSPEAAYSAVRFTLGYQTTREEIDATMEVLKRLVEKLRSME